jgi:ribonucleotide reductase beta subunit family protein with ferritin-like domain
MSIEEVVRAIDPAELEDLEERGRPFRALYEHWEANQWSPFDIDLTRDRASFEALDETSRDGFLWIFSHRFHAEFSVARLLAPFLRHAPDWDMQVLIATQVADEHRHMQGVLRIYDEVFGVRGIDAARALADQHSDFVRETLNVTLDEILLQLDRTGAVDDYVRSAVAYHLIAEGVVARCAQNLAAGQYERYGSFPGLTAGQRLVARDEARHIGIGVSYVRRMLADVPEARTWVDDVLTLFATQAAELLQRALGEEGLHVQALAGYGVEPTGFYNEAMRLLRVRMRSIGYLDDDD